MLRNIRHGRWLIATTLVVASCSQGDSSGPASPSTAAAAPNGSGTAGSLAEGDVRIGPGPIAIEAVRMDRQTPSGASILRQYANPGQEYRMGVGEQIELWVEWVRGGNNAPTNPRLLVDWGDGLERDFINCGVCLLRHTYPLAGRYTVKVTLDDRAGTTVARTFVLNSLDPTVACVPPTSIPIPDQSATIVQTAPFFTGINLLFSADASFNNNASHEVSGLGNVGSFTINPLTGAMDFSQSNCTCVLVTATNSCGSTSQGFDWCDD